MNMKLFLNLLAIVAFTLAIATESSAQKYNEHYSNGWSWLANVGADGTGHSPVMGNRKTGEVVDCDIDRERCQELIKKAREEEKNPGPKPSTPGPGETNPDPGTQNPGNGGGNEEGGGKDGGGKEETGGKEPNTNSYLDPNELAQYELQLKIKYGTWRYKDGKWIFIYNILEQASEEMKAVIYGK